MTDKSELPPASGNPASMIFLRYFGLIDRLYGLHFDTSIAFRLFRSSIEQNVGKDDKNLFILDEPDPNRDDALYKHVTTTNKMIERSTPDGENDKLLSILFIVLIYTVWDTHVRPRYAEAIGRQQDDVKSDLFGDLRWYRHGIIHNNGVLERATKVLDFVKVGGPIFLTHAQLVQLFSLLYDELSRINQGFTGEALLSPFKRRLNPEREFAKKT